MSADLLIIVPTRSRPEAVAKVVNAWTETGAFAQGAELLFVVDQDDPRYLDYSSEIDKARQRMSGVGWSSLPEWRPLVPKLNTIADEESQDRPPGFAIGFAGDDHLPRTHGWAMAYHNMLTAVGTGIVSCPDGYRPDTLPTQWAMTADIVREFGAMVPAPVEHLYCDNVVQDLAEAAGCYQYLDDLLIEHMHPVAGKADRDEQYERVNGHDQFRRDRRAYREWRQLDLHRQAAQIRALRGIGATA